MPACSSRPQRQGWASRSSSSGRCHAAQHSSPSSSPSPLLSPSSSSCSSSRGLSSSPPPLFPRALLPLPSLEHPPPPFPSPSSPVPPSFLHIFLCFVPSFPNRCLPPSLPSCLRSFAPPSPKPIEPRLLRSTRLSVISVSFPQNRLCTAFLIAVRLCLLCPLQHRSRHGGDAAGERRRHAEHPSHDPAGRAPQSRQGAPSLLPLSTPPLPTLPLPSPLLSLLCLYFPAPPPSPQGPSPPSEAADLLRPQERCPWRGGAVAEPLPRK